VVITGSNERIKETGSETQVSQIEIRKVATVAVHTSLTMKFQRE